jgi:hypothetical protein
MSNHKVELLKLSSPEEKLNYLNTLNFPFQIIHIDNKYSLSLLNLELSAQDTSLDLAHKELEKKKYQYFNEMIKSEREAEICFPPLIKPKGIFDVLASIGQIALQFKTLISFIVIFILVLRTFSMVGSQFKKSSKRLSEKIKQNIETVSEEKTARRINRLNSYLDFIRPYYIELKKFDKTIEKEANK